MMHSNHFLAQTGIKFSSSLISKRSSDELIAIHRDLNAFERGDYPKFKPEARWDFMLKLAGKCELYMKDKQAKGRDLSKPKHLCVQQLSAELTREVAAERNKAQKYGSRVAVARQYASAHDAWRPALIVKGQVYGPGSLITCAEGAGIRVSGNDNVDAFALREWLKHLARQNKLEEHCVAPLRAYDREQRRKRRLSFRGGKCFHDGKPFDPGFPGCFVISESDEWYTVEPSRAEEYVSIGELSCGGRMNVVNGALQWISHFPFAPLRKMDGFLTVVEHLRRSGLDQAARHKISFFVEDDDDRYGPRDSWGSRRSYLFPYSVFAQANGKVPDPSAYEVGRYNREHPGSWKKPSARRHGCHHLGTRPDGRIDFPA